MVNRAVLYARVSGDDRLNATSSVAGQLEMCREYATEQGYRIVAELAEDGNRMTSGASWDLPQLGRAIQLAEERAYDVLVVREIDRLARGLAKQLVLEEQLKNLGIKVEYVIGQFADTPEGQLNKQIRAVIAEFEKEKINERMIRGRRRKVRAGSVIVHGNPPFGYDVVESDGMTKLIINEAMARTVRLIFDLYVNDRLSTIAIARRLNELGVPTPSNARKCRTPRSLGGWKCVAVNRIIKNETYAGVWRYGKRHTAKGIARPQSYQIEVEVPAIVSREIWEKAQDQRRRNRKESTRNTKREYLLARRAKCAECGTPLVSFTQQDRKRGYSYYRCPVTKHTDTHYVDRHCSTRKYYRVDHWDAIVWEEVKNLLRSETIVQEGLKRIKQRQDDVNRPISERLVVIDRLLAQKQAQLERLLDLYISGEFARDVLDERKRRYEAEIRALMNEHDSLEEQLSIVLSDDEAAELLAFTRDVARGLEAADHDFELRRQIVRTLDVRVQLGYEDGEEFAFLQVNLDTGRRLLTKELNELRPETPFPPLGSALEASSPAAESGSYTSIDKHSTDCTRN